MSDYMFMLESHLSSDQGRVVAEVQSAAVQANMNVFLTGGAIRDMLGGFPIAEIDVTVEGNAIKLAYLSNSLSKLPRRDDVVLFYRSHDRNAITTLGVIERYEWMDQPEEIARLVSRRTVYSEGQIARMTRAMRTGETKVMLFMLIKHFDNPVTYQQLQRSLRVVRGPIQSITQISDESFSRILASANR